MEGNCKTVGNELPEVHITAHKQLVHPHIESCRKSTMKQSHRVLLKVVSLEGMVS